MCDWNQGSGSQYYQMVITWQLHPLYSLAAACFRVAVCLQAAARLLYSMLARFYRPQGQVTTKASLS